MQVCNNPVIDEYNTFLNETLFNNSKYNIMITVYDSIKSYCYEHQINIPSQKQCFIIGYIAIVEWKKFTEGKYVKIKKTSQLQPVEVNAYPDEFSERLNETVKRYFADPAAFCVKEYSKVLSANRPHTSFRVGNNKCMVFESAAKELNLEINIISTGDDYTKYEICFIKKNQLIALGMLFSEKLQLQASTAVKLEKPKRKRISVKKQTA